MGARTTNRPHWLPDDWRMPFTSTAIQIGKINCNCGCGRKASHGAFPPGDESPGWFWANGCEQAAKAAICGGDE